MSQQARSQVNPLPKTSFTPVQSNLLQRKCGCGQSASLTGQCSECQRKKLAPERGLTDSTNESEAPPVVHELLRASSKKIQPKLKVSQPNDKYEQEADRIADQVMRMPELSVQRQMKTEEEETLQAKPSDNQTLPLIQRQAESEEGEEEECVQAKANSQIQRQEVAEEEEEKPLQAKRSSNQSPSITPAIESQIQTLQQSGGQPLSPSVRKFMEPRFNQDFSGVHIHSTQNASRLAYHLNAQAFTFGRDIFFGAGKFNSQTRVGQQLLAHELAHTVQQGASRSLVLRDVLDNNFSSTTSAEVASPSENQLPEDLNCSRRQNSKVSSAISLAQKRFSRTKSLVESEDNNTTELAKKIFGAVELASVKNLLGEIEPKVNMLTTERTGVPVLCGTDQTDNCVDPQVLAFVPSDHEEISVKYITLCPDFFKSEKKPNEKNDTEARARTILHEAVHLSLTNEPDIYIYQRLFSVLPELGGEITLRNPDTIALFIMRAATGTKVTKVEQEITKKRGSPADRVEGLSENESLLVRTALGVVSKTAQEISGLLAIVIYASQKGYDFGTSLRDFLSFVTGLDLGIVKLPVPKEERCGEMPREMSRCLNEMWRAIVKRNATRFEDTEMGAGNVEAQLEGRGLTIKKVNTGGVTIDGTRNEIGIGPDALPGGFIRRIPVQTSLTETPTVTMESIDRVDRGTLKFFLTHLVKPLVTEFSGLGESDLDTAIVRLIEKFSETEVIQKIAPSEQPGVVLSKSAVEMLRSNSPS